MIKKEDVFKIGQFAKPHGINGEISLLTDCDIFDDSEEQFVICDLDGILVPFFVEEYRYKSESVLLLKLEGVDSDEDAKVFNNKDVYYPLEKADRDLLLGDISWDNFEGFEVVDKSAGPLGIVVAVDDSTANVLLQVDHQGQELLIPIAEELVISIDYELRKLYMSVPEGLLSL